MGILDALLGTLSGGNQPDQPAGNALADALGGLIQQHGGMQELAGLFASKGLGDVFSSWVGLTPNHPITADQIQQVLGNAQVSSLAAKVGLDSAQVSSLLAQYLPAIIDKLTPSGQVDPAHDVQGGLAALVQGGLGKLLS